MTEQSFQSVLSETAARFLQSAVVLDDRVVCEPWVGMANTPQPSPGLQEPLGRKTTAETGEPVPNTGKETDADGDGRHRFELFPVAHGFAARGIVCGALNPLAGNGGDQDAAFEGILKAGRRADIVILDWQIKGRDNKDDDGSMAMELMDKLVQADSETGMARRRLVVIYTGEALDSVVSRFDNKFEPKGFADPCADPIGDPCRQKGGFRVVFLPKSGDFSELPGKAIEEFARMNTGLLSGAVLNGLAAIRDNTHRILSRFSPELDGAYLAHRAMTVPPQEAKTHIGPLLASEVEDVLAGAGLEESLSLEVVKQWLADGGAANAGSIEKMLSEGAENNPPEGKSKKQWLKSLKGNPHTLTEFISGRSLDEVKKTDEQFAALTTLRFPATTDHRMTLGTVVREGDGDTYWLCITPACDCVRLTGKRHRLFFLRCKPAGNGGKIHFLVPSDGEGAEYIPITVGFRIEDGHHWECEPDPDKQMVLAKRSEDGKSFYFPTTGKAKLHWVAELKSAHALRITHRFASKWSRVGVTEAEWLRRSSDL